MRWDPVLAFGVVLISGGLAILTVLAWRGIDQWVARRRLAATALDDGEERRAEPLASCGVPTFGTERCGLLAGHADRRHLSWPSGRPYPPRRYDQCDETCTTDCGHCKGQGPPPPVGNDLDVEALADGHYDDQVLELDPPVVPRERLNAVGGWVEVGGRKVHRSCNEDRRDGRHHLVCQVCADRLGMAPAGGAT